MPYPTSPFPENFDHGLIKNLSNNEISSTVSQERYEATLRWLCTSPSISTYRVNILKCTVQSVIQLIRQNFEQPLPSYLLPHERFCQESLYIPYIGVNALIDNVIIIKNFSVKDDMMRFDKEIIIDVDCASAVLRGANIYAPGIIGMSSGTKINEKVSIYADICGKCKKGLRKYDDNSEKVFIGNGIARMQRHELFREGFKPFGLGVSVTETISGCPTLDEYMIPAGFALLQNSPSVLAVLALDPMVGETIIDLCASPGNKTTHIAELMKNKGILIAIDKTPKKIEILKKKCEIFGATNVHIFQADSTKIVQNEDEETGEHLTSGPPFPEGSFDRILLDAPCSALGKRPQFTNKMKPKEIRSFVPLQRKLMETAVRLLKPNGTLVYSTCTITFAENEGIVAWALNKFKNLSLSTPALNVGEPGWPGTSLTDVELRRVRRFGPDSLDSVGFFYCVFKKKNALPIKSGNQ